jgi:hypothetical protein
MSESDETAVSARTGGADPVELVVCHPLLPLVAGLDTARPVVRIWEHGQDGFRELGVVEAESDGYGDLDGWDKAQVRPAVAWHPRDARLLVAREDGVVQWTPGEGMREVPGPAHTADYRSVAFDPDGRTWWGTPAATEDGEGDWDRSDVVDLATGAVRPGPRWDTGVATHPGGGLVATLQSDQGATLGVFARPGPDGVPRVLDRGLVLDVDGYETPVFSPDGRHFAVRGNAYENTLEVFALPSLERVLATTLGESSPGYPYPQEWLDEMHSWSRWNVAFAGHPCRLWIGTPTGSLIAVDVERHEAAEHRVTGGAAVTALAATATGDLVVADAAGGLALVATPGEPDAAAAGASAAGARDAFLATADDVPDDASAWEALTMTDGTRTWDHENLEAVDTADASDPTWLQIQAAMNRMRAQGRIEST